jgi:hypothetical protein
VKGEKVARWLMLASGSAMCAGEAAAGAWTQPSGHSQSINSVSRERGPSGEIWRTDSLGEYGLAENWGGRLRLESQLTLDEGPGDKLSVEAGIQRAFRLRPRSSLQVSASLLAGEALEGPDCRGGGYETRLGLGQSFALGGREGFVVVEGALRSRGSACERIVTEAAVGTQLGLGFRTVAKAYTEQGDGARSAKVEAMLLYDYKKYSLGFGYRREISGAFKEEGWVVSVWQRF